MSLPHLPTRLLFCFSLLTYSTLATAVTLSPALVHQTGAKPVMAQENTLNPALQAQGVVQPAANTTIAVRSGQDNGYQTLYISQMLPIVTQSQPQFSILMQNAQIAKNTFKLSRPVRRMMRSLYPQNLTRRAALTPEMAYSVHVALQDDLHAPRQENQLRIIDRSEVTVVANLNQDRLAMAQIGDNVRIKANGSTKSTEGRIHYIHSVDPQTHTAEVHIRLPNPNLYFTPNMSVAVEMQSAPKQALLIPREAVLFTDKGAHVLISGHDGQVEPRAVTLGSSGNAQVEVLSGLTAGEYVMTAANKLLKANKDLQSAVKNASQPQSAIPNDA